ncbi:MAG: hypothetical protein IT557_04085 [Alphaproteobacteria bacterium]|nr:hypothetical protein [Alphaproteobacteria bacterium]
MRKSIIALPLLLGLAACGNSTGDRAISGGAIGAGAGMAIGAVTGVGLLNGALIGGGVGAATGVLTSSKSVNLGRPAWR